MDHLFLALRDAMGQELAAYRQMLALSEQKTNVLIKNDVAELDRIVAAERRLLTQTGQLKAQREEATRLLYETRAEVSLGGVDEGACAGACVEGAVNSPSALPRQVPHLQDIIGFADRETHEELLNIKNELAHVVSRLSECNGQNKKLIITQLKYSAFCVAAMTSAEGEFNTYSQRGDVEDHERRSNLLIDQTV